MLYDSHCGHVNVFGGSRKGGTVYEDLNDLWTLIIPILDADLDGSGVADGNDIMYLMHAIAGGSTDNNDLDHADFDMNGIIGVGDIQGFVNKIISE
ncbi:MAG: hypothetical protein AMXMBFR20_09140 [Planctomycetia bacterium]